MQNIASAEELKEAIQELEKKQAVQKQELQEKFRHALENLKYFNLIKNAFSEVTQSPDLINNVINTALSLIAGYFSKKIFVGGSGNVLKKIFGAILQTVVAYMVTKNYESINGINLTW